MINTDGYRTYRRRDNGGTVKIRSVVIDNHWMIPYNLSLNKKFNAHINFQICNRIRVVKYLYKYIHKGEDKATIVIEKNLQGPTALGQPQYTIVDEIKQYLDCGYISAPKSCRWIFHFKIHDRQPLIERLQFHLQDQQIVVFRDDNNLHSIVNNPILAYYVHSMV